MKNQDVSFAFLTLIVLAGLVAACLPSASATTAAQYRASVLVQRLSAPAHLPAPGIVAVGRAQS
jgi:hypothetical protein